MINTAFSSETGVQKSHITRQGIIVQMMAILINISHTTFGRIFSVSMESDSISF